MKQKGAKWHVRRWLSWRDEGEDEGGSKLGEEDNEPVHPFRLLVKAKGKHPTM